MTPNRRSVIVLLIGVIAALTGFATTAFLRQRRCQGAGAQWRSGARECVVATGDRVDVASWSDVALGLLVALALGFMLFRVLMFVMGRGPRRTP